MMAPSFFAKLRNAKVLEVSGDPLELVLSTGDGPSHKFCLTIEGPWTIDPHIDTKELVGQVLHSFSTTDKATEFHIGGHVIGVLWHEYESWNIAGLDYLWLGGPDYQEPEYQ